MMSCNRFLGWILGFCGRASIWLKSSSRYITAPQALKPPASSRCAFSDPGAACNLPAVNVHCLAAWFLMRDAAECDPEKRD